MNATNEGFRRQAISLVVVVIAFCVSLCAAHAQNTVASTVMQSDTLGVGKQRLNGYRRPEFANAPLIGPLEPLAVLNLAISLLVQNRKAFDALAREVSNPQSSSYRKFLTPDPFSGHTSRKAECIIHVYAQPWAFAKGVR